MTQEFLEGLLAAILSGLSAIIATCAVVMAQKAAKWLDSKTSFLDSERDIGKKQAIIQGIENLVRGSVMEVFQTYVDALKKNGKFTPDEARKSRATAVEKIKTRASKEYAETMLEITGCNNFTDAAIDLVEREIAELKLLNSPS